MTSLPADAIRAKALKPEAAGMVLRATLRSNEPVFGAKLKSLFEEQAKRRQIEAAKAGGSKTSEDFYEKSVTKVENKVVPNLAPPPDSCKSRDKAASVVNVSHGSIDNASKVIKTGSPE